MFVNHLLKPCSCKNRFESQKVHRIGKGIIRFVFGCHFSRCHRSSVFDISFETTISFLIPSVLSFNCSVIVNSPLSFHSGSSRKVYSVRDWFRNSSTTRIIWRSRVVSYMDDAVLMNNVSLDQYSYLYYCYYRWCWWVAGPEKLLFITSVPHEDRQASFGLLPTSYYSIWITGIGIIGLVANSKGIDVKPSYIKSLRNCECPVVWKFV